MSRSMLYKHFTKMSSSSKAGRVSPLSSLCVLVVNGQMTTSLEAKNDSRQVSVTKYLAGNGKGGVRLRFVERSYRDLSVFLRALYCCFCRTPLWRFISHDNPPRRWGLPPLPLLVACRLPVLNRRRPADSHVFCVALISHQN